MTRINSLVPPQSGWWCYTHSQEVRSNKNKLTQNMSVIFNVTTSSGSNFSLHTLKVMVQHSPFSKVGKGPQVVPNISSCMLCISATSSNYSMIGRLNYKWRCYILPWLFGWLHFHAVTLLLQKTNVSETKKTIKNTLDASFDKAQLKCTRTSQFHALTGAVRS